MKRILVSSLLVLCLCFSLCGFALAAPADISGTYFSLDESSEYMVINSEGSGMLVRDGLAYRLTWTLDGSTLSCTDSTGQSLSFELVGDSILRGERSYTKTGESAPVMKLAPERWAQGLGYVTDQADILTPSEEDELASRAQDISESCGCAVYILTLSDMRDFSLGSSVELCAEEISCGYDLGLGEGRDQILLLLSMAERDYSLTAYGDAANRAFTDYAKGCMEDEFLDDFGDDEWFDGFSDYLGEAERMLIASENGTPVDVTTPQGRPASTGGAILISLALGFIIALIVCLVLKSGMRSAKEQAEADGYISKNGVSFSDRRDIYTHTTETRVYDPPENNSSSGGGTSVGGGGFSHSSGKF